MKRRLYAAVAGGCAATLAVVVNLGDVRPESPEARDHLDRLEVFAPDCLSVQEKNWGVQILYLRLSPDHRVVTVRYRVVDVERAGLFRRFVDRARLHDARSGAVLAVAGNAVEDPLLGGINDMVFSNHDGSVGPRHRVALTVGPFRLDNLVVRR
ncbi:MAG: hypothetical protein AB1918_16335 [Pseudomonadota bacterium]